MIFVVHYLHLHVPLEHIIVSDTVSLFSYLDLMKMSSSKGVTQSEQISNADPFYECERNLRDNIEGNLEKLYSINTSRQKTEAATNETILIEKMSNETKKAFIYNIHSMVIALQLFFILIERCIF